MSGDLRDLPLFAGISCTPSAQQAAVKPKAARRAGKPIAKKSVALPAAPIMPPNPQAVDGIPPPAITSCFGRVIPFPPHRDLRMVGKLLDRWFGLLKRHRIEAAYRLFNHNFEDPIRHRLMKLGFTKREIDAEILRVEHAMETLHHYRQGQRQRGGSVA